MSFDVVFALMIAVILLVLGGLLIFYLYIFFLEREEDVKLQHEGMTTDGEVVDWKWQGGAKTGVGWRVTSIVAGFLTYSFRVDVPGQRTQIFTHTNNVWLWMHWRYPVGARIPIRYLPDDPTQCQIK